MIITILIIIAVLIFLFLIFLLIYKKLYKPWKEEDNKEFLNWAADRV